MEVAARDDPKATLRAWTRQPCPSCKRSYKFFCPICFVPLGAPEGVTVPSLALPVQIHVWFQDKIKKSTAPHAKVLAPKDVQIIPFPITEDNSIPSTYTFENTVVVYPTPEAETLDKLPRETLEGIQNMVFIDSPWQKAPVILQDPALAGLRCVKLATPPHHSKFWRYHQAGAGCVSTIEAIQLMLSEFIAAMKAAGAVLPPSADKVEPADLLFYFNLVHTCIADTYENDPNQKRKPPMDEGEKERQRILRNQKDAGKRRRIENKREAWERISRALETGEIQELPRSGKCYNCKKHGHEAKDCTAPCRYCKQAGHYSGVCTMRGDRQDQAQQQAQSRTKAL